MGADRGVAPVRPDEALGHRALDGVRGLAAQVVLLGHALELAFPVVGVKSALVFWVSRLAVMVFFTLSGFVIAGSLARLSRGGPGFLLPYAVHRAARILPPLVAAVAVTFTVAALGRAGLPLLGLRAADPEIGFAAFLRGVTLTFSTRDATFALDGPVWSLRQEVWLYGLAGLAALAVVRRGLVRLLAGAGVAAMVVVTADRFFYPQSLALFGAGALVALLGREGRIAAAGRSPLTAAVLLALVVAPLLWWPLDAAFLDDMSNAPGFLAYQSLLAIPLALAVLGLAEGRSRAATLLARGSGMAAFSYTLYVVHNPLLVLVFSVAAAQGWLAGSLGTVSTLLVALALAQTASLVLARVVERPRLFRALAFRGLAALGLRRLGGGVGPQSASPRSAARPSR